MLQQLLTPGKEDSELGEGRIKDKTQAASFLPLKSRSADTKEKGKTTDLDLKIMP